MSAIEKFYSRDDIQQMLQQYGFTDLSHMLQDRHCSESGFSEKSLRRFCISHGIRFRNFLPNNQIDQVVFQATTEVGNLYGRKMMTGYLKTKGLNISEKKVGKSLKRVNPPAHQARCSTAGRSLNPKVYKADYFGNKLHVDQNEKLVMFGVTHVCCRDGFSGLIVANTTMPLKNNVRIYEDIYVNALRRYGMWDQLRVDGGKEFVLICHVQGMLQGKRRNLSLTPFKCTKSTENQVIERIWVEVNRLVNYPIKDIMVNLVHQQLIDMSDEKIKFCVSSVLTPVSQYGLGVFVESWNHHRIQGKGIPYRLAYQNNQCMPIEAGDIPSTEDAVSSFRMLGGTLKEESVFGLDPLRGIDRAIKLRSDTFYHHFDPKTLFEDVQKKGDLLHRAISYYIYLTDFYSRSINRDYPL